MIPDFFHALTAWRKFDVAAHARILASAGHTDHWWPTADLGEAICRAYQNHDAPQLECTCGFYCFKARVDAEQHQQGSILARVEIWGRLAEHRRGYRAQYMRIEELFVSPSFSARPALESRYHVPVTVDQGADTWISENPCGLSPWSQLQSLPVSQLPYLLQNQVNPSPYQPSGQHQQQLFNQQLAQAQTQYHQQYQAMVNQIAAIAAAPQAPFMLPRGVSIPPVATSRPARFDVLFGVASVGTSINTTLTAYWAEIAADEEAKIVEDFDAMADRVTKHLTENT